jgi:hypothetical protein
VSMFKRYFLISPGASTGGESLNRFHNRAEVFSVLVGGKLDERTERSLINSSRQVQLLLPQPSIIQHQKGVRQLAQETSRPRRMKPMAEVRSSQRQRNGPGQRFPDMSLHATEAPMFSITAAALRPFAI